MPVLMPLPSATAASGSPRAASQSASPTASDAQQSVGGNSREGSTVNDQGNAWTRLFQTLLSKTSNATVKPAGAQAPSVAAAKTPGGTDTLSSPSSTSTQVLNAPVTQSAVLQNADELASATSAPASTTASAVNNAASADEQALAAVTGVATAAQPTTPVASGQTALPNIAASLVAALADTSQQTPSAAAPSTGSSRDVGSGRQSRVAKQNATQSADGASTVQTAALASSSLAAVGVVAGPAAPASTVSTQSGDATTVRAAGLSQTSATAGYQFIATDSGSIPVSHAAIAAALGSNATGGIDSSDAQQANAVNPASITQTQTTQSAMPIAAQAVVSPLALRGASDQILGSHAGNSTVATVAASTNASATAAATPQPIPMTTVAGATQAAAATNVVALAASDSLNAPTVPAGASGSSAVGNGAGATESSDGVDPLVARIDAGKAGSVLQATQSPVALRQAADTTALPAGATSAPQTTTTVVAQGPTLGDVIKDDSQIASDAKASSKSPVNVLDGQGLAGLGTAATTTANAQSGQSADSLVQTSSVQERIDVANQVAGHISAMQANAAISNGTQHATVQIQPPQWGEMKISVTVQSAAAAAAGDGVRGVQAVVTARSAAVRDAILSHDQDLRGALEASGLKLDKLSVVIGSQSSSSLDPGTSGSNSSSRDHQAYQPQAQSQLNPQGGGGSGNNSQSSWSNSWRGEGTAASAYGGGDSTSTGIDSTTAVDSIVAPAGRVDYRI